MYIDPASGLTPDPSLHGTYLDIEPVTGMTLSYHKRFQVQFRSPIYNIVD